MLLMDTIEISFHLTPISYALGLISHMLSKACVPCFGVNTIVKVFTQRQFLTLVNTIVLLFSIRHSLKYYYQTLEQYRGLTPAISLDKMLQQDYILFTLFPELRLS